MQHTCPPHPGRWSHTGIVADCETREAKSNFARRCNFSLKPCQVGCWRVRFVRCFVELRRRP